MADEVLISATAIKARSSLHTARDTHTRTHASVRECALVCVHVGGWVSAVRNGVYTYHYLRPTSGFVRLLR